MWCGRRSVPNFWGWLDTSVLSRWSIWVVNTVSWIEPLEGKVKGLSFVIQKGNVNHYLEYHIPIGLEFDLDSHTVHHHVDIYDVYRVGVDF